MVDRVKAWEAERRLDGAAAFRARCAELDRAYDELETRLGIATGRRGGRLQRLNRPLPPLTEQVAAEPRQIAAQERAQRTLQQIGSGVAAPRRAFHTRLAYVPTVPRVASPGRPVASPRPRAAPPGRHAPSPVPSAASPGRRVVSPAPRAASPVRRAALRVPRAALHRPPAASPGRHAALRGPRAALRVPLAASPVRRVASLVRRAASPVRHLPCQREVRLYLSQLSGDRRQRPRYRGRHDRCRGLAATAAVRDPMQRRRR